MCIRDSLNGQPIGLIKNCDYFVNTLRKLRRKGIIHEFVSVSKSVTQRNIFIASDGGRLTRPLIIVQNGQKKLKSEHIQMLEMGIKSFKDLVKEGLVEYLDVNEENDALIAIDETYINDQKIPHILDLLKEVDFGDLSEGTPVRFHGDFILDNILYDGSSFKLLDWRQDFQGCLEAGDLYYDLAKLNHNLSLNHNVLDNNLFTLETTKDGNMRCEVLIPSINLECQKRYYKWLEENRLSIKKVKFLTSIIWLNMCPLHEYPLNRFLFHFGKYNLFLNLEEY